MKALVIAAGPMDCPNLDVLARAADLILAADGGARYALSAEMMPHVVVGDVDSLHEDEVALLRDAGCEIVRAPARKDETDLELALRLALERGATEIDIVGALGARIDHTLGNVFLLTMPELAPIWVRILDGLAELYLLRGEGTILGSVGDIVSLIPLTAEVSGIRTRGLEYPLRGESLFMGAARGVSNVLAAPEASVSLERGLLLVVITHTAAGRQRGCE